MKSFLADLRNQIADRFFKPTNAQMLTSAADHGVELAQPVPFTFYIAFRLSDDADRVADLLVAKGYAATREAEDEDLYPYLVEAEVSFVADEREIERHEALFRGYAAEFQARYDDYSIAYTDEEAEFF